MTKTWNPRHRRAISFGLAFLMAFAAFAGLYTAAAPAAAADRSIAEIEKEQKELDAKIKSTNAKISSTSAQIKTAKDKQASLQAQIGNIEEQLVLYSQKIDVVNEAIAVKQIELEQKNQDIAENEQLFANRVHQMYIENVSKSTLATLFESKSFSEFLNRMEFMKRISQKDEDIVNELIRQRQSLDQMKAELETEQAELLATKGDLDARETELGGLYDQVAGDLSDLQKEQRQELENQKKYEAENKALEAEMQKALEALKSAEAYGDGILKWPVPGHTTISSPFGYRTLFGVRDWHTGIDISTNRQIGPAIVAADNGKVVWYKKVSYGYGWHLLVDHGNGVSTLYAHTSAILVNAGDMVQKGQTIAQVGSTGNSTGPHLHFEVRINGVQKNPLEFVSPGK